MLLFLYDMYRGMPQCNYVEPIFLMLMHFMQQFVSTISTDQKQIYVVDLFVLTSNALVVQMHHYFVS
jgi:hypothetical protein